MAELVRYDLGEGAELLVEDRDAPPGAPVRVGPVGDTFRKAAQSLHAALGPVRIMARTVLEELREAEPSEIAVEFGVSLTAEAGAVIARTESTAHLTVTLTWKSPQP
jgi:hypothetical protein